MRQLDVFPFACAPDAPSTSAMATPRVAGRCHDARFLIVSPILSSCYWGPDAMRRRTSPSRANEALSHPTELQLRPGATAPREIPLEGFKLREWRRGDVESLAKHADNIKIWRNLHDAFPHPYRRVDAEIWIEQTSKLQPGLIYAIEVEGEAAGGIGITPMKFEHRRTAAIGYWLSEAYWGRGITTKAMRAMTDMVFATFDLARLEALVFE